jgi:hypothetical protein
MTTLAERIYRGDTVSVRGADSSADSRPFTIASKPDRHGLGLRFYAVISAGRETDRRYHLHDRDTIENWAAALVLVEVVNEVA